MSNKRTFTPRPRAYRATDNATGYRFQKDKSTTKAVAIRMENMQYYLRGEAPPLKELC